MTQLLIGRSVEGRETRMHSSLVDWPPGRKDARWRGGLWLYVDLPLREHTLLCVVSFLLGLGLSSRQELNELAVKITLKIH